MDLEFNQPIAQRFIQDSKGTVVTVELGAPRLFEEKSPGQGWYCAFRVVGIDEEPWTSFSGGIDSIQAIILALARIGDFLDSRSDLELSFEGCRNLGFLSAKLPPISDGAEAE